MDTKLKKTKEEVLKLLQDEGKSTYRIIEEHLKTNKIEHNGKFLNKILQKMIEDDKTIERLDEKPRAVYRLRLDTYRNLELHGTFYKEYVGNTLLKNSDKIFEEITSKNKIKNSDEAYLKKWIEFFGLYVFTALMESNAVITKIQDEETRKLYQPISTQFKNKKITKKEYLKQQKALFEEFNKQKPTRQIKQEQFIHSWLSKALSLENGSKLGRTSFIKMMNGFRKSDNETSMKTMLRVDETLKKLYPQTAGIIRNTELTSNNILEMLQEKNYKSIKQFETIIRIITGNLSDEDRKTRDEIKQENEKLAEELLEKKFNTNF